MAPLPTPWIRFCVFVWREMKICLVIKIFLFISCYEMLI
jgi:hypothetical protein